MRNLGVPGSASADSALGGIYYAVVTNNKDDEKKLGRIKVRFPWLAGGDTDESTWAHIAVPMIGDKFGTWFLPEVEDVVAVVFMAGDINHPIVIGGVWSKEDPPPEVNEDGKNDFRLIKSRSGHRVLIDDTSETKVVFTDKDDENYMGIGKFPEGGSSDNKMEMATPSAINGSAESGVAINSVQGTVNIWCPKGTLKITAKNIEITASTTIDVKAGADMLHESSTKATFSGTAGVKMAGSKTNIGP